MHSRGKFVSPLVCTVGIGSIPIVWSDTVKGTVTSKWGARKYSLERLSLVLILLNRMQVMRSVYQLRNNMDN